MSGSTESYKKKPTVGRFFKGDTGRTKSGTYFSVSFKAKDMDLFYMIKQIMEEKKMSASEIFVDAIRLQFGNRDLSLTKEMVLQRYVDGSLKGPSLFKTFEDVLEWELQNTKHCEIPLKWQISSQAFSCLLYLYGMTSLREQTRNYVTPR